MIIFVKHGTTENEDQKILKGWLPIGLSTEGKEQASQIAEIISRMNILFNRVISSDLNRAVQTAEIIGKQLSLPVEQWTILRERNAGSATGKTDDQIDWVSYEKQPIETRKHPEGESLQEVRSRAEEFLKLVDDENYVVVSHDAFIKMMISVIDSKAVSDAVKIDINNKIIKFDKKNGKLEIIP